MPRPTRRYGIVAIAWLAIATGCLDRQLIALNPCLVSSVSRVVSVNDIDKVDLLFMVDNSDSMAEEQNSLRQQFPKLIDVLTTGMRTPDDPKPFPAAKDLHLAVVSSDMGAVGQDGVSGCDPNGGDDGRLQNLPRGSIGCQASYPSFLSYIAQRDTPLQVADDFACIAELGTGGCGYEHQLEAPFKALWPSVYKDALGNVVTPNPYTFVGTTADAMLGRGDLPAPDGSLGFLRNDPNTGLSLLAIVIVSDEDDCSAKDPHIFTADPKDPLAKQGTQVRCFMNPKALFDPQRYIDGFMKLRPGYEKLVVFAGIVGVPTDLVDASARAAVASADANARNAYYTRLLSDARMQNVVIPSQNPELTALTPSCTRRDVTGQLSTAFPPRRIVQVAQGFGANGVIQSICQDDFGPAMDAIIELIAQQLGAVCLPRPLVRRADGLVSCDVIWELPQAGSAPASTPTECTQLGFLKPVASGSAVNDRGGANCSVAQLPIMVDGKVPAGSGWYYDNFSSDANSTCSGSQRQRVAFTKAAHPTTGVTVRLQCLNETQVLPVSADDVDGGADSPEIGSGCVDVKRGDDTVSGDDACMVSGASGPDQTLFCHPNLNLCVKRCQSATDCPASWQCDTRPESLALTQNRPFCVNPTCGFD